MNTKTQAGLDKSVEFLSDSVELAHLVLKRKLAAARAGEDIDWKEAQQVMKEGRAGARQIAQVASIELRERKQKLVEDHIAEQQALRRPSPKSKARPKREPDPADREKLMEISTEWMGQLAEAGKDPQKLAQLDYPEGLKELFEKYGVDPRSRDPLGVLTEWLFPEARAA